ncbi:thyrotropin-releasing hormone receptor [Elysia marginata]|uniref:Thyrotropin-releasing hormone receptor n=1 Tax=Elysia marginata TaxID=1093978 RepID=A0AAV4GWL3_9GAST|nr:thyrotropin-releasing hormone receptor [Elysia marginata]
MAGTETTVEVLEEAVTKVLDMMTGVTESWPQEMVANMSSSTSLPTTTTMGTTTTTKKPCFVWTQPPCDSIIQGAYDLAVYGVYVSYAVGIPGSILTLIVLSRMRPFNSSSAWLCCLSSIDLAGLGVRMFLSIYQTEWHWVNWWCRLYYITARTTKHASFYCLVGLTVERFIAVWFPLKMTQWCTIRRALISFFAILVILVSSDLHMIETRRVNHNHRCIIRFKYRPFWQNTYEKYIQLTFFQTVPMLTIITLNILIALRLRHQRKLQKEMSDQKSKDKDKQQRQIDRMLVAATCCFSLFVLPQIIFEYTERTWVIGSLGQDFIRERARHVLVLTCNTLNIFNHAVNFILYVLVAQKFR